MGKTSLDNGKGGLRCDFYFHIWVQIFLVLQATWLQGWDHTTYPGLDAILKLKIQRVVV